MSALLDHPETDTVLGLRDRALLTLLYGTGIRASECDLVQEGVGLVTLRDLLGHQQITSTQIYIHLTAQDLRKATDKHPVSKLIKRVEELLPNIKLPFQSGTLARFG